MSQKGEKLLYHYCPTDSLVKIVQTRSIWLSSLTLSNDSLEGRLVKSTLMTLAAKRRMPHDKRRQLESSFEFVESVNDGLGFCLSEAPDLLSQWRGYADDGRGVSIGFSKELLLAQAKESKADPHTSYSLFKVKYRPDEHELLVTPTYDELHKLINEGAFRDKGPVGLLDLRSDEEILEDDRRTESMNMALFLHMLALLPKLFELKSPAFREEREWRLVSVASREGQGSKCQFRAHRGRVIPYRIVKLAPEPAQVIRRIVLGPKHETPESVVRSMLEQAGFEGTEVSRSKASYR